MMNSLLKRQLKKYLNPELSTSPELKSFLDAIDRSYDNFEEQFTMQQRAMTISSEELSEANKLLRTEYEAQQKVIDRLKRVMKTMSDLGQDDKSCLLYTSPSPRDA